MAKRYTSSHYSAMQSIRLVLAPYDMGGAESFMVTSVEALGIFMRVAVPLCGSPGLPRHVLQRYSSVSVYRFNRHWPEVSALLKEAAPDRWVLRDDLDWLKVQRISIGRPALRHLFETLVDFWGPACAYCGATDCDLEIEHIVPRARGGEDDIGNLTLACQSCNAKKGTRTAEEFGHPHIHEMAKRIQ